MLDIAAYVAYQQETLQAAEAELETLRTQGADAASKIAEQQNQIAEYKEKLQQGGVYSPRISY